MPVTNGTDQRTERRTPPPEPVTRADLEPIATTVQRTANELAAHDAAVESRIETIEANVLHMTEMLDELHRSVRAAVGRAPAARTRTAQPRSQSRARSSSASPAAKPETLTEAMLAVFGRSRTSLTAKQIHDRIMAREGHRPGGATPEATISAKLATENAKGGKFERTAPGKYRVRR